MIPNALKDAETRMKGAVHALEENLASIRTGRASPALVDKIMVDYYGTPTPMYQVATINAPEPMLLTIRPFDKGLAKAIEKAIQQSDLHISPTMDGPLIRLNLPMMTTERRKEMVKVVHTRLEESKVALRNVRRDAIEELRKLEKDKKVSEDEKAGGEQQIQKMTDRYLGEIEQIGKHKETEVMSV